MVARSQPNQIRITRVYDAPLTAVWDAWTDPEQVAQWWGPRGFTLTTHSKDLRPGGTWNYTMHGPDGVDYPNTTLYHIVEPYQKLVYDHGAYEDRPPIFQVTALFSETDGKTTLDLTMTLPTAEAAAEARKFIKAAGGNATWDRLAEFLAEKDERQTIFVINRSFPASVEQLFTLWTQPEHLAKWLPPDGFDMTILRADFHASGDCFFRMSNRTDLTFYGKFEFREITPPSRIVYLQRFCDADERPARHPALPVFPETMQVTVEFSAEDDFLARVTVISTPWGVASAEELAAFIALRPSMTQGWTGSFDKLETLLIPAEGIV